VPQGIVWCDEGVRGMSRHMFVWSMRRGPRVGEPCETTPGNQDASRVPQKISHLERGPRCVGDGVLVPKSPDDGHFMVATGTRS
jgi:hypothetical protein